MELDESSPALRVDQPEGVDTESLHHPVAAGYAAIRRNPQERVGGLGHQRGEVPEVVVGRGGLGHLVVRLGFDGMHQVGKVDGILDEEHRHVVPHQIEVPLRGVELGGEPPHIPGRIERTAKPHHRGEADEHRCLEARILLRTRRW